MKHYSSDIERVLARAGWKAIQNKRSYWVFATANGFTIADKPNPFQDQYSVRYLPMCGRAGAVETRKVERITAHPAVV